MDSVDPAAASAALPWVEDLLAGRRPERAFRELFEMYNRPVWRFFARRGFPPEDCHDLTQETFVRVYSGISSFRGEARFETWLFSIATNTYRKALRYDGAEKRAGHEVPLEEPEGGVRSEVEVSREGASAPGEGAAPLESILEEERRLALRQAVTGLPDQMRRCVVLRIYQDMPYREIADALQVSIETVKAHLFQARKRLKSELAETFESVDL